nr:immunoglobulin heavy chain junction region [Mus musculus]NSM04932.1 immunoglobulin heavy chain junction region [Mus musculus]NSM06291.1 immunoglobulin heavy chain junction region [Mus musculus]NSM07160.1 immunoglobulin heavy chain junction region [Mus musculus]NSM07632.1 immunoglobulin heavy chain junction region [Mus musculus]
CARKDYYYGSSYAMDYW